MLSGVDPTILVALVTASGVVISAAIGGSVTLLVSRRERKKESRAAAENNAEAARQAQMEVLRERLTLRDEQNQALVARNQGLGARIEQLETVNGRLVNHILELQERLDRHGSLNVGGNDMEYQALDQIEDADVLAGEVVEPEHDLDLSTFEPVEDEEDDEE